LECGILAFKIGIQFEYVCQT